MSIGLVTIGQSPRPDLLRPIEVATNNSVELELTGALDGMSLADVDQIAPEDGDIPLVTQMESSATVTISHRHVVPLLQQRLHEHETAGRDLLVVLCTGSFPELTADVPMLMPDRVLCHFVAGTFSAGTLGIIAPATEQEDMIRKKWSAYPNIAVDFLNPYDENGFTPGNPDLKDCSLVVLDCMGYSNTTKKMVREHLNAPVVVAQEVLASAVRLLT